MVNHPIHLWDAFHFPILPGPHYSWHKEWLHFCVVGPGAEVVFNLNLSGDPRPGAPIGNRLARVVLLAFDGSWKGDIEPVPSDDVRIRPGLVDVAMGGNSVVFDGERFLLHGSLAGIPLSLDAELVPETAPLEVRSEVALGEGRIGWLAVPRLSARGAVTVGQASYPLEGALAYHDHNWGAWLWGQDFSWEWGFGLPDDATCPWSVVFDRTTNRGRTSVKELTLALWRRDRLFRLFTQDQVSVRRHGFLPPRRLPKFPRVMALATPEITTDIPAVLEVRAGQGDDWVRLAFSAVDPMQIVVPNDTDLESTVINEVRGRVSATGCVRGEGVEVAGTGIFEFLT